jgi:hypothetical protein
MERVHADVRVTAPVTAELVAHALREAVKFLLFVRQQIPASYDELRAALLQTVGPEAMGLPSAREADGALASPVSSPVGAKRKRVTSVERAALKLFREMDAALGCLTPEMLRAFEPSRVALFLGSTPARPKEMFVFSLAELYARGGYASQDREESPEARRALGNAGRRVVRECLPAVSRCSPASAVGKAFVMVRARGVALARAGAHTATSRVRRSTVPNGRITSHRHPHHSVIIRSKDGAKTKRKPSRLRHFLTAHASTRTRIVFHSVLPYRATHRSPTRSAAARSSRSIPKSKICTAPTGPPCRRSSPWSPRS